MIFIVLILAAVLLSVLLFLPVAVCLYAVSMVFPVTFTWGRAVVISFVMSVIYVIFAGRGK